MVVSAVMREARSDPRRQSSHPSSELLGLAVGPVAAQPPAPTPAQDGDAQVLTRGPVHEAFAAPVVHDSKPGLTVPKEPPQPVEEMPPDQKPAGQNVQWISGYWSWDQTRNDFVWLSGVWREPPPGRQWVPGYWHQVEGGYQWVAGAWVPVNPPRTPVQAQVAASGQASYLPAPPASLETGPNSPAPSQGVFWSPGSWYWQENRYVWRPGFWAAAQPTWVWVPAHFVWTPGGYLFVEGYWDLPLASRGLMFAPVYYPQPVYLQPAYVFTPSITIATPGLVANLFVQPGYGHYVFGDYYDRSFLSFGIFPWFSFTYMSGPSRPLFYDPVFSFYASVNISRDPGWVTRMRRSTSSGETTSPCVPRAPYIEQTRIIERNVNVHQQPHGPAHSRARRPRGRRRHADGTGERRVTGSNGKQRAADLRQFRAERSQQERQASRWRAIRIRRGSEPGHRPGPSPAPVAARVSRLGPDPQSCRRRQRVRPDRACGAHGPGRRAASRSESIAHAQGASPLIRHSRESEPVASNHSSPVGQAAPHDTGRSPLPRSQPSLVAHGTASSSRRPAASLPAPVHPPPAASAPRPLSRQEHETGRRGP